MKKRLRTVFLAARIKLATSVVSAMEIMQRILRDGLSAALGDKSVLTNVKNFRNSRLGFELVSAWRTGYRNPGFDCSISLVPWLLAWCR